MSSTTILVSVITNPSSTCHFLPAFLSVFTARHFWAYFVSS